MNIIPQPTNIFSHTRARRSQILHFFLWKNGWYAGNGTCQLNADARSGQVHFQISSDTGGKYYYATSLPQLDDAFRQISDELRTQYLLAYYPSERHSNSEFRQLRVDLANAPAGGPYQSHYRAGYYTHKGTF